MEERLTADTCEALGKLIDEYFRKWPQSGYGTWVKAITNSKEGWTAVIYRYTSCD